MWHIRLVVKAVAATGLCALLPACTSARAMTIVEQGQSRASIIIAPDADARVRAAAEDLQYHLRMMSGAEVPVSTEHAGASNAIWLGVTPPGLVLPEGIDLQDRRHFWPDGYLIVADDGWGIALLAPRWDGVRNAVYGLLQDYLGCYWFTMGDIGEHIPRRATVKITVAGGHDLQRPSYEIRSPWYNGNAIARMTPEERADHAVWRIRNRQSGVHREAGGLRGYGGHEWSRIYTRSMQEQDLELAPEIGGVRTPSGPEAQFCLSHPRAAEIGAEYLINRFNADPGLDYWSFSQNDSRVWCGCARCAEYGGNNSERMLKLTNAVAERVARGHPDKRIQFMVYAAAVDVPSSHHEPNPNVVGQFCSYFMEQVLPKTADNDYTNTWRERVEGWMPMLASAWTYDYYGFYPGPWPLFSNHQADEDWYRSLGVTGMIPEGYDRQMGTDVLQWLCFQTSWDASRRVSDLLGIFYPAYYGEAGAEMRATFESFEEHMLNTGSTGIISDAPALYPVPLVEDALARVSRARAGAADPLIVARLERDENCLKLTRLIVEVWDAAGEFYRTGSEDARRRAVAADEAYLSLMDSLEGTLTVGATSRRFLGGPHFSAPGAFGYDDNLDGGGKAYHAVGLSGFHAARWGLNLRPGASGEVVYDISTREGLRFRTVHLRRMYLALPEGGSNGVAISLDGGTTWQTAHENVKWAGGTLQPDLSEWVAGSGSFLLRFRVFNGSEREVVAIDNWGIGGLIE